MEKNFIIRMISKGDFKHWQDQFKKYLDFYETRVSEEIYRETFKRLINPKITNQNALVAQKDNKLIGIAHFIYHPHNWKMEDVCYLQDLFVEKNFRGWGVGYSLITHIYSLADKHRTPTVYWLTQDFNIQARKLYDRIGNVTNFIRYNRT